MAKYHGYGEITREFRSLKPNKKLCSGCYCESYHYGLGGSNLCWSFETARVVSKLAYCNIYALFKSKIKKTLSCYHGVNK